MRLSRKGLDKVTVLVLASFIILIAFTYLPSFSFSFCGLDAISIKRFDLTSDIYEAQTAALSTKTLDNVIDTIVGENRSHDEGVSQISEKVDSTQVIHSKPSTPEVTMLKSMFANSENDYSVTFEDYSETGQLRLFAKLLSKIKSSGRSMRIAFLGDSFIEADILTTDIRDLLQSVYGGVGVGFVPISSPSPMLRTSVEQSSSGWTTYSMAHYNEADWKRLTISGFYYVPSEDATFSVKTRRKDNGRENCQHARLLFVNEKASVLTVSINGAAPQTYTPPSSRSLQTLEFTGEIHALSFTVSNVDGFYAYGVSLDGDSGIYVDNYSVRGSSGIVLSTADETLSNEFGKILSPDVLVLQYGLNVASADITNYDYYRKKMVEVIKRLARFYPNTVFLVMGVGDRSVKNGTELETMPSIFAMVDVQRGIAQDAGCLFWNTFKAMGGKNSMVAYVSHHPPLASKDYTHINHAGGKEIAQAFVFSVLEEVEAVDSCEIEVLPVDSCMQKPMSVDSCESVELKVVKPECNE